MTCGKILLGLLVCLLCGWAQQGVLPPAAPLGLPMIAWPRDNPYSAAKVELGKLLYFDRRLSADGTVSCASCHDPKMAFTDNAPVSTGIKSQHGIRSAPTVINRAYSQAQYWDGRAATLEEQVKEPIANPLEMGITHEAAAERLRKIKGYRPLFKGAFGSEQIDIDRVAKAIATFERTVLSGNSRYDRYNNGDPRAMNVQEVRGMEIFFGRANCGRCHEGPNFTSNGYSNIGVGSDKPEPDVGRYAVTQDARDWGVFKTPTLREIEHTWPYMHDGSMKSLEEVVEYYNKGGIRNRNLDPSMKMLHMNESEKAALVAFLLALSGEGWQQIQAPASFPR
uniref:Methylamine utilization protein MauG n=1 Tax=Solibacter usitatus (strain Ellin6076) TaxID=234267 RepID=Q01SD6_SOLUE